MTKQTKYPDFISHNTVDRNYTTKTLETLVTNSENEKIKEFVKKYPEFVYTDNVKTKQYYVSGDIAVNVVEIKEIVAHIAEKSNAHSKYIDLHKDWTQVLMSDRGKMVGDILINAGVDDGTIY